MRRVAVGIALSTLLSTACVSVAPAVGVVGVSAPLAANVSGRLLYVRNGAIEELTSGGNKELAKENPAVGTFMDPAWSPDGTHIAYAVRQKNFSDIGIMNADGTNQTLLTHDQSPNVQDNLWAAMPTWSPDGAQLVFSSDRGKQEPNIDLRLWELTLSTRAYRQVSVPELQAGGDADAQFRPGHPGQVVYTRWAYDSSATAAYAVLVLHDLNSGTYTTLTSPKETAFQPAWSPDGKTLAFIRRTTNGDALYVAPVPATVTADITVKATLLESGVNAQPAWSPDGSTIAYIAEDNNQFDLFDVGVVTSPTLGAHGKPQQLTSDGVDATSRPSWVR